MEENNQQQTEEFIETPLDSGRDDGQYVEEDQIEYQQFQHSDEDYNSENYPQNQVSSAREVFEKEKRRLKLEEERLRREEETLSRKAKEDAKSKLESLKKEKERLKREKEDTLRRAKEAIKKENQKLRRLTFDFYKDVQDISEGWMKMRGSLKNWHLRWFVLRPGKLIYYKDELHKDCQGIIMLANCTVSPRNTKKDGFCFKIMHPRKHSIYSTRGLKGETLPSGLMPLTADHCILRVNSEEERTKWMEAINEAITKAVPAYFRRFSLSEDGMIGQNGLKSIENSDAEKLEEDLNEEPNSSPDDNLDFEDDDILNHDPTFDDNSNRITVPPSNELIPVPTSTKPQRKNTRVYKSTSYAPDIESTESSSSDSPPGEGPSDSGFQEELGQDSRTLVLGLLKQLKIGMDLSRVVLPTFILEPRSMLEKVSDFLTHAELLAEVPKLNDPLERIVGLVKWYMSGFYIKPKGVKKPYNPILGEFFRCMWVHPSNSKTIFVAEQVSHHPPISAFYASNRQEGFVVNGSILFRSRFNGTSVGSILDGFATISILPHGEEYEITFPSAYAKGFLFGTLLMELTGSVNVICKQSGYRAEIEFKQKPLLGGEYNVVAAKIRHNKDTLYTIHGKWDGDISITNCATKSTELLWSPTPAIRKNKLIKQKPIKELRGEFESDNLWQKVTAAIKSGDQQTATDEKAALEQTQRAAAKYREVNKTSYKPRLFFKDPQSGIWVYKYLNKSLWDQSKEIEEYEVNGVIRSRKEDGSSSEASDDDEILDNKELLVLNAEIEKKKASRSNQPTSTFASSNVMGAGPNSNSIISSSSGRLISENRNVNPPSPQMSRTSKMVSNSPPNNTRRKSSLSNPTRTSMSYNNPTTTTITALPTTTVITTTKSSNPSSPSDEWRKQMEVKMNKIEKDLALLISRQNQPNVNNVPSLMAVANNNRVLMLVIIVAALLVHYLRG